MKNTKLNAKRFLAASIHTGTTELLVEYGKEVTKGLREVLTRWEKCWWERKEEIVTVQKVLKMLRGNRFERWYAKEFVDFISGQPEAKSRALILKDLKDMLQKDITTSC